MSVASIDAALPQTQCRQCGYAGCLPYANAIANGEAAINRCPPGGDALIRRLARITGQAALPLDPACGTHKPRQIARVDEDRCIGCALCIQACPVDAIVGAPKLMHTVIAAQCTGCELCVPPCPVDCIVLEPAPWSVAERALRAPRRAARAARLRFAARNARLARTRSEHRERLAARTTQPQAKAIDPVDPALEKKRAIVERAQARARARLAAVRSGGTR